MCVCIIIIAVHRIDRLTSGILIFARLEATSGLQLGRVMIFHYRCVATAQRLEKEIKDRKVNKKYLCKVEGEFPR